jgi:Tfp pilus assembly protein PilX
MERSSKNNQRGIALLFVLFALVLLTGLAAGLLFMTSTEAGINANYGSAQVSYFGARSGGRAMKR